MCSLSSGFIQIRSISRIRTFSSPCLTVPVLAFSIRWLPERFGIYIITDHFLKLVQVSPQRNTAVNVWDLQVSSLNLKVNLEEETLPNSVTSSESLLKNYFIDSPFTLSSAPTWCFCSSSFHCFYSFYLWWFYAISAVLIACIPFCLCWFMLTFCVSTFFWVWASFCLVFILFHCLPEFPAFSFSLSKQVVASVLSIKQDPNTHV